MARERSLKATIEEVEKCVCLCRNCHAEFHFLYGQDAAEPELELYAGRKVQPINIPKFC